MNPDLRAFIDNIEGVKENLIFLLDSLFGKFWFLFVFLLLLNLADIITGTMRARVLKKESSQASTIGLCKKIFLWVLVFISFGLSLMFIKLGQLLDMKMDFMLCLGWGVLLHCITNEVRSILENIISIDVNSKIVPKWFVKGLEVYQKIIEERFSDRVSKNLDVYAREDKQDYGIVNKDIEGGEKSEGKKVTKCTNKKK